MDVWVVNRTTEWDGRVDEPPEAVFSTEEAARKYCKRKGYHGMARYSGNIAKLTIDSEAPEAKTR